ncbi:MAG: hypothetical protein JW781_02510 [Deltaproteobacteria bacterium]|nr:hypothetical protein [Candidatus Anaeroferrophillacea bacterium]
MLITLNMLEILYMHGSTSFRQDEQENKEYAPAMEVRQASRAAAPGKR